VPVVLALAEKRLEAAQPVGGPVAGICDFKLEILAQVVQAAEHRGQVQPARGVPPDGARKLIPQDWLS
jgi:hypothetical protein